MEEFQLLVHRRLDGIGLGEPEIVEYVVGMIEDKEGLTEYLQEAANGQSIEFLSELLEEWEKFQVRPIYKQINTLADALRYFSIVNSARETLKKD